MLTDTHAHLYWDSFEADFEEVIKRAIDAGITTIINVGVDIPTSKKAFDQLAKLTDFSAYSTIGIHPHEAENFSEDQITELENIYLGNPQKVIAIGECGLDYVNISQDQKKLQFKLLQAQVTLSKKLDLPLLIHCRDGWEDIFEFLRGTRGILHCYSGDLEITKKALGTNFLFSFAGNLTYPKNDYLREAARIIPMDRIVLETDCPFLPPQSKRGEKNEPSLILETAQMLANLKNLSFKEIESQTEKNVKMIFKL